MSSMKDKSLWTGVIIGIVIFVLGMAIIQILPGILAATVPVAAIGLLYLTWRLVQAVERIADAMERQQIAEHRSEPSAEESP